MRMTKLRIFFFLLTLFVVGIVSFLVLLYAKGYRFNNKSQSLEPHGLLVMKSDPDGAQIIVDGETKGVTNTNLSLISGSYDITIKRDGFQDWNKRLTITEGEVTEATAHLFRVAPSLTPLTFNGAENPLMSNDGGKIAFAVPKKSNDDLHNQNIAGLYVLENVDLPVGFLQEPRRITNADTIEGLWIWSADDRQILLLNQKGAYILDVGGFTSQDRLINIFSTLPQTISLWQEEYQKRFASEIKALPLPLVDILERRTERVIFSPDSDMIMYTASSSATLQADLIKEIPGASTQKEERLLKEDQTYIYDIKEDRNFAVYTQNEGLLVSNKDIFDLISNLISAQAKPFGLTELPDIGLFTKRLAWFPTSRHIISVENATISLMDYDGTNKKEIYSGSFVAPYVFPTLSLNRLIILTNLGGTSSTPNLYSLSIK